MDETVSISTQKDFEIIKQIGKGSFGTVFKVRRLRDSQIYAMKTINISKMDKKGIESSLNEIRILCSVNHPCVVAYKDAFLERNNTEINVIMEYVGGGDLSAKIAQCSKRKLLINEDTIWKYFCQTLMGLKALHSMKIIHRDIKSANLFLTDDFETVKLGDMNVAKIAKNDLASTQIGTPYYLAPEIWKNEVYSYKCDVFSLGCVLYEMAALRVPFEGTSLQDLYKKITRGIINKIPREYSDDLYAIIKLCLANDPRQRPSVSQLLAHPVIAAKMGLLNIDFKNEQIVLDKLMNTIKIDKNFNKVKISLPNSKRYRTRSADNLRSGEERGLVGRKDSCKMAENNSPVKNYVSSKANIEIPGLKLANLPDPNAKDFSSHKLSTETAEKGKDGKDVQNKPTKKLPPVKITVKTNTPPLKAHVIGQLVANQRDSSKGKHFKPKDHIENPLEVYNGINRAKNVIPEVKRSRNKVSSAEPRRQQLNINNNRNNVPVWWG